MKDGELSSSTKNTNKPIDPADMSLEELLKADLAQESKPASLRRAAHGRDDEPGSGLVKLAEMVAKSAQDASGPFATVSSVPPVPITTPAEGIQVPEASTASAPVPPKRSSSSIVFAALIIAAAVLAGFYIFGNRQQPEDMERLASALPKENINVNAAGDREDLATEVMAARMAPAQEAEKAEAPTPALPSPDKEAENQQKPTEDKANEEKIDEQTSEGKAPEAEPEKTPTGKTGAESTQKAPRTAAAKTKRRAKAASPKSSAVTPPKEKVPPKAKKGSAEVKKDGAADLDALLGAPNQADKPAEKTAEKSQGLAKPNRQQVKKAMTPVTRKAQICSKYSTGTIQLKLVVNNKGRVVSSKALPPFASTNAGKCVEMLARTAKFPEFSEPSFTVNYPVILK